MLLAVQCGGPAVTFKKSLINHPQVETWTFVGMMFGMENVVGYYYDSLMYNDKTQPQHTTKMHGEAFLLKI